MDTLTATKITMNTEVFIGIARVTLLISDSLTQKEIANRSLLFKSSFPSCYGNNLAKVIAYKSHGSLSMICWLL